MPLVLDGTNGVSGVDGTASNPSYEGTDSNTGIFYPAADTVAIGTGGTERVRVVSAGDVGIGTSTPATISNRTVLSINNASNGGALNLLVNGTETLRLLTDNSSFGYVYNVANQPLVFGTNGNERMRIDASGNVGINDTSPSGRGLLSVRLSDGRHFAVGSNAQPVARYDDNGTPQFTFINYGITGADQGYQMTWQFGDAAANFATAGRIIVRTQQAWTSTASTKDAYMSFFTAADGVDSERARITSAGAFVVAKTSAVLSIAGSYLQEDGFIGATRSSNAPLGINRLTNDGDLIFFQQDNTQEGSISVSGTTVSYNGGHLSRYAQTQAAKDESILKGTVLSNLDEMNVYVRPTTYWTEEDELPEGVSVGDVKEESAVVANEQLNKVKVSDVEGDVNVAGVFVNWTYDEQHQVDEINMAMTGDMIIRIAQSVSVQKGDLLMSAGDGTAKPQGDDIVRSKTIAKVTSNHVTCTYDDGSYCVPCVLMAC